jgi:WD40 repeat protein
MHLATGARLGPYEILAFAGAGGMGEVYRARDTRLKREVALKVLPEDVAADPDRSQRFEREAHAVAALNHPNIVAIYDIGSAGGAAYIVTEFVDGQPLRGPLGWRKVLDCALQISNGLAAAHAAGIVHRDLKPDNIFLTAAGNIKILDFGLAKLGSTRGPVPATETMTMKTASGVVMGTVGYMSPEQVRGEEIDHRSDIFSLGVILYELLAGRRAFQAETSVESMMAILKQDLPDLPDTVPTGFRRLIERCLAKSPENRFQSTRDLGYALDAVAAGGSRSETALEPPKASPWRRRIVAGAAALVFAALVLAASRFLMHPPAPVEWSGAILGGPDGATDPRPSPDGHLIAFEVSDQGLAQVAVMKPETGNWSQLTHSQQHGTVQNLAWAPDGTSIYYDRATSVPRGIYSVPVLGGEEHLVYPDAIRPETLKDGSLLAVKLTANHEWQLFRFWPSTGRVQDLPVAVIDQNDSLAAPRAFPDGQAAVVDGAPLGEESRGLRLLLVDLSTGKTRPLAPGLPRPSTGWSFGIAPDGKSVLAAYGQGSFTRVISVPVDSRASIRTLFTTAGQLWYIDGASDGSVYASLTDIPADLVIRPLDRDQPESITRFPSVANPNLITVLPDGRVVTTFDYSGRVHLQVAEPGKNAVAMVSTTEETSAPVTMAGPREIAFLIGPDPRYTIAFAEIETGRITHRISPHKGAIVSLAASPEGGTLYFSDGATVWSVPSAGGEPRKIRAGNRVVMDPNGKALLVSVLESPKMRLFRVPLNGGPEKEIVPDGNHAVEYSQLSAGAWNADGRLLVPLSDNRHYAPAVLDTVTGHIQPLPFDNASDYYSFGWLAGNRMVALRLHMHAVLWQFTPLRPNAQ